MDMYLSREKTIRDSVKLAKPLVDTLSSMQADCEERYSSKKSILWGGVMESNIKMLSINHFVLGGSCENVGSF